MNYKRIYSIGLNGLEWGRKDFCIHHINLNHYDDSFDNLVLIPSKLHREFHFLYNSVKDYKDLFSSELNGAVHTDLVISGVMKFFTVKKQMERFYDLKRLILDGCFYGVHDFQKIVNSCCFIAGNGKRVKE